MNNLTQEYINDLRQTAHMADRTSDHKREMSHVNSLQTKYNRLTGVGKQLKLYFPIEKMTTKGYKASSVEDAVNQMEKFFGGDCLCFQ